MKSRSYPAIEHCWPAKHLLYELAELIRSTGLHYFGSRVFHLSPLDRNDDYQRSLIMASSK